MSPCRLVVAAVVVVSGCSGTSAGTTTINTGTTPSTETIAPAITETPSSPTDGSSTSGTTPTVTPAGPGESFDTLVPSEAIGDIAVRVTLPEVLRYPEGAPVVVEVTTFFTPREGFPEGIAVGEVGMIHVSYLWPGTEDASGSSSDGDRDYGGEQSIAALRDVIRFASGVVPDREGRLLSDLIGIVPLTDQVGLYAFSHPGLAAVNVLAIHGSEIPNVRWFVGRENPIDDVQSAVEIGHWEGDRPMANPRYEYPSTYSPTSLTVDFSGARWDPSYADGSGTVGRAYLDLDGDGIRGPDDFTFGSRIPQMFGKRFHSIALTRALEESVMVDWPTDLATAAETESVWPFLVSAPKYPDVGRELPDLKVMLVFADRDHVQPALDKPHIHQAYDGFRQGAGLWVRLNPDRAYLESISADPAPGAPDNPANSEPTDWLDVRSWAHRNTAGSGMLVPLAAVAEMADRTHWDVWADDLLTVIS